MKTQNDLEILLEKAYAEYLENSKQIFPGNKLLKDNYCKMISLTMKNDPFLYSPEIQKKEIEKLKSLFENLDENPKMMYLYPDFLQYEQMKDLEYRNTPEKTKEELVNYFIHKFFKLNNLQEKIISKSNQILNFNHLDEKFISIKDLKLCKIKIEIDYTLKRIMRLLNPDNHSNKDFEYYLRHFKVKKLDSIFIKPEQTNKHYNLRKDDFEVYFRDVCYYDKSTNHLNLFKSVIKFLPVKNKINTWKNSKIYLNTYFKKLYEDSIRKVTLIYSSEKSKCEASDIKLFKEYFKSKYEFYYKLKEKHESNSSCEMSYDVLYPPLIITLNSEIKCILKELCDHFNLKFDISIDKGRAFSYALELFFPNYFNQQNKNFSYNSYELTINELANSTIPLNLIDPKNSSLIDIESETTGVLRNKYNLQDGFVTKTNINLNLKNTSFVSEIYIKKAKWVSYFCLTPNIDDRFYLLKKQLDSIAHMDSLLKYELELIDSVDLTTLNRLIEDYTLNITKRVRNTVKLVNHTDINIKTNPAENYSQLKSLVKEILNNKCEDGELDSGNQSKNLTTGNQITFNDKLNKSHSDAFKPFDLPTNDEYAEKVDGDLLKYLLTLRFLKMRDYKFYIINLLNYFRYIQKKFVVDLYKIENKSWKKSNDLDNLTESLSGTLKKNQENIKNSKFKLITHTSVSEYTQTNPIIPSIENITDNKKEFNEFNQILIDEVDEIVEYTDKVIRIKNNKGNFIIYDATLSDMKDLEQEIEKIGTYFIQKHEELVVDTESVPNPFIDRSEVILDLLINEFEYLYSKFEFIHELVTCYEHICDPFLQKSLMQIIIDNISKRPIVDLNNYYFISSYQMEIEVLRKKAAMMRVFIDYQKKQEHFENQQTYASIDKFYWLLGETALEIIRHIRLDKLDVEILKKYIDESKSHQRDPIDIEAVENLVNLFEGVKKEKEMEVLVSEQIGSFEKDLNSCKNVIEVDDLSPQSPLGLSDSANSDKFIKQLKILIIFLKKLFSKAITGYSDDFIEDSIESLVDVDSPEFISIKETVSHSLIKIETEKEKLNKNFNQHFNKFSSKSFSMSNESLDHLNFKVRSLLNIPLSLNETDSLKGNKMHPNVISSINKDLNFTKFEEGYPNRLEEENKLNTIEYLDSLSIIIPLYKLIEESFLEIDNEFVRGDYVSVKGLEISYIDSVIEHWKEFAEFMSNKKKNLGFNQILFLQDTLLDNHQSLMYILKSLTGVLSNPINRIPKHLLTKLPISIIEKNHIDRKLETEMDTQHECPSNLPDIENLILENMSKALITTLISDMKSDWVTYPNDDFNELKFYCNMVELYRTKEVIKKIVTNNSILKIIYENQKIEYLNKQDDLFSFKNTLLKVDKNDKNFVDSILYETIISDDRPDRGSAESLWFSISEFDETLQNCLNFHNVNQCQINTLDSGLIELKSFGHYEYMNFHLLLIAVQHNSLIFSEPSKYLAEVDLFEHYRITVSNKLFNPEAEGLVNDFTSKIMKGKKKGQTSDKNINHILFDCRNKVKRFISKLGKEFFYSIVNKKLKNRINNNITQKYEIFMESLKYNMKSETTKLIYSRHYRILMLNAYAKDIMIDTFLDAIKIQNCMANKNLKKLMGIVPREYWMFDINTLNFLEIDTLNLYLDKNFVFFNDRSSSKKVSNIYLPSDYEIFRLENQTDQDIVYHYSQYNSLELINDPHDVNFFQQFYNFFLSPKACDKLENFRNKFFEEANNYQSNSLLFLQIITFFINLLNLKLVELNSDQQSVKLFDYYYLGLDFWGDKDNSILKVDNTLQNTKPLPLNIVDYMIHAEKNYLNLRTEFDKLKIDMNYVIQDLIFYLKENVDSKVKQYMETFMHYMLSYRLNVLLQLREECIKTEDFKTGSFLNKIISKFKSVDYFKENSCHFPCHISNRTLNQIEKSNYHTNNLNMRNIKFHHFMSHTSEKQNSEIRFIYDHIQFNNYFSKDICGFNHISIYDDTRIYYLLFSESKLNHMREISFKLNNRVSKYLIYLEINKQKNDLITFYTKKIEFLDIFQKLFEFKYKFMIIYKNKFISIKREKFIKLESEVDDLFSNSSEEVDSSLDINNCNKSLLTSLNNETNNTDALKITNSKQRRISSVLISQIDENYKKIFEDISEKEKISENTYFIENFLTNSFTMFKNYQKEINSFMLSKGILTLKTSNKALLELFQAAKNDLDINIFQNKFCMNTVKQLDKVHILSLHRKFSFLETFINRIYNISLEVETHDVSNSLLITKREFDDSFINLINEFLTYETTLSRSQHLAYCYEKYGYFLKIKKLDTLSQILMSKLKDFDTNLEKISNAKLALAGNKLVYEMDNLYRQLKILKDNICIMEDYIKKYYEDKFNNIITSLKTEACVIENKFHQFKDNLKTSTVQKITEEYNNCLKELKSKNQKSRHSNIFISNKHEIAGDEPCAPFDHQNENFYLEIENQLNYNNELNKERKKFEILTEDVSKLHVFYRMKLNHQKIKYEKELEELKQTLSSNGDLWDKLGIAEQNEKIIKEELSKTQKSLATAEEFIKKLQSQIRKLHDKNVSLEKQLSSFSTQQIINNASKSIESFKSMELYNDTRQPFFYNINAGNSNVSLIGAIENVKNTYKNNSNVKLILENFEALSNKYSEEVNNKRRYITSLVELKKDIQRMQESDKRKVDSLVVEIDKLKDENRVIRFELERYKNISAISERNLNFSKFSNDKFK